MKNVLPRAVIFDWDNTLVDSWGAIGEAVNHVRARYGKPVWPREEIPDRCTRSARDSFPEMFGDKWQEAMDAFYVHFRKARERDGIHPAEGAKDLLAWLLDNRIPAIVVSNKMGEHLRHEATHLGWDHYFASIVGARDAIRDKPAREHADHALSLAGLEASPDIWFIGDGESDVACARAIGCIPLLIGNQATAQTLGVAHFFTGCREILEQLNAIKSALP